MGSYGSNPPLAEEMKLVSIREEGADGKNVRVTGRIKWHDFINCRAELTSVEKKTAASVIIDTTLIEPYWLKKGSIFQFIGVLDFQSEGQNVLLRATIVRCLDGLDPFVYCIALEHQNKYLAE